MWRLVLTVSLLCCSSAAKVTCRDENNGEKDWYILYKAPKQGALTGLEYIYIDSSGVREVVPQTASASPGGTASSAPTYKPINDPGGILANTLRPLFTPIRAMPQNFGFLSYSDQPPGCNADRKFGHSKGVLMVDKYDTGVWLLHSTPQFPFERDQNTFWPATGADNAQTFICVTFPYKEFQHIGQHLQYIGAFPFQYDIPDDFHQQLKDAANWVQPVPVDDFQPLVSSGGFHIQSIAKNIGDIAEDGDLYVTITQRVSSDLLVQTWGCQSLRSSSFCEHNKLKVENIISVKTDRGGWRATVDHSKWCVAKNPQNNWICIADVNRAVTQYQRRGGALCMNNKDVKNAFMKYVVNFEDCKDKHILIMDILNTDCVPPPVTLLLPSTTATNHTEELEWPFFLNSNETSAAPPVQPVL